MFLTLVFQSILISDPPLMLASSPSRASNQASGMRMLVEYKEIKKRGQGASWVRTKGGMITNAYS